MKGDPLETLEKFAKKSLTKPKTTIGSIWKKFLKSIRLKSHSAEKPKRGHLGPLNVFYKPKLQKMQGVPFDDIRKFSKKVEMCRKNPKGDPLVSPAVLLEA